MKSKHIRIVCFSDDILIFARDKKTAGNYKAYAKKILEEELKLTVNKGKTKLKSVFKRKITNIIRDLNPVIRGWINYYKIANIKSLIKNIMSWIRRRLRMIKMKQWKTYKAMHKEMRRQGIKGNGEKMAVTKWKNSKVHIIHLLLPNKLFHDLGLIDLTEYEVGLLSNYY